MIYNFLFSFPLSNSIYISFIYLFFFFSFSFLFPFFPLFSAALPCSNPWASCNSSRPPPTRTRFPPCPCGTPGRTWRSWRWRTRSSGRVFSSQGPARVSRARVSPGPFFSSYFLHRVFFFLEAGLAGAGGHRRNPHHTARECQTRCRRSSRDCPAQRRAAGIGGWWWKERGRSWSQKDWIAGVSCCMVV